MRDDGIDAGTPDIPATGRKQDLSTGATPPGRVAAMERLLAATPDTAALIATTGFTGRELYTVADRP